MKAISIQQPWAWLIVNGFKDIENRDWPTRFRGRISIHAGKKFDKEGYEWVKSEFPEIPLPAPHEFDRGGLVGAATIIDCVTESSSPWFFGQYGFVIADATPSPLAHCRGQLGIFIADVSL